MSPLERLRASVAVWNQWREVNPRVYPNLDGEDLSTLDLRTANFREANMARVRLIGCNLEGADFAGARLSGAVLAQTNLSDTKGLDALDSTSDVSVDLVTLARSKGRLPQAFLNCVAGFGAFPTLGPELRPGRERPSLFLSYSTADEVVARLLSDRLAAEGLRVFFAPDGLEAGVALREQLRARVKAHARMVILLSRSSINSTWVRFEVETLLADLGKSPDSLIPISLDTAWLETRADFPRWTLLLAERNVIHLGGTPTGQQIDRCVRQLLACL